MKKQYETKVKEKRADIEFLLSNALKTTQLERSQAIEYIMSLNA